MRKKKKILLAEDDLNFGSVLRDYLTVNGYEVKLCSDGLVAMAAFEKESFDLCISDIMMPYSDGFTLVSEIRKVNTSIPFIFLTAKTLKEDMIKAYKIGADDYLVKPFDSELLLYKILAVFKRKGTEPGSVESIEVGGYEFAIAERKLKYRDKQQKLSPKEAQLLKLLNEHVNEILPRTKVLKEIWGDDNYFNGRSMDVYITKLRKYLSGDPAIIIENLHGTGFILKIKNTG